MFEAIEIKSKNITELLIAKGADVNTINKDGGSPLFMAINENAICIIMLLIENGADLTLLPQEEQEKLKKKIQLIKAGKIDV